MRRANEGRVMDVKSEDTVENSYQLRLLYRGKQSREREGKVLMVPFAALYLSTRSVASGV